MSAECRLSLPRGVDYLGLRCHVELDRGPIRWKVLPKTNIEHTTSVRPRPIAEISKVTGKSTYEQNSTTHLFQQSLKYSLTYMFISISIEI
jgi:hypothetical protein